MGTHTPPARPSARPSACGRRAVRVPEPIAGPWADAVADWAEVLAARGTAPATINGYARHVGWLAHDLARTCVDPWRLTPAQLTGWLDVQNWSTLTRRKVVGSLRNFYAWAVADARCQRSPLAGVSAAPRKRSGPAPQVLPDAWREPVATWLAGMQAGAYSPATIEHHTRWVRQLAEVYADPWTLTPDDLAVFLSREDWAPETKRAGRSVLRTFYAWAERAGHVPTSPARDLPSVRVPRAVPRPTPDAALSTALARADDRTRLAVALAAYAGLRRAEIAGLHTRDIGPDALRVTGKGGHVRLVPLHPDLAALLRAELHRRAEGREATGWTCTPDAEGGWLFPSTQNGGHITPAHLGKLVRSVLPGEWTTHTLRHRFATRAYAVDRDLRVVQELLGHASPTTTVRYAQAPGPALIAAVNGVTAPPHLTVHAVS